MSGLRWTLLAGGLAVALPGPGNAQQTRADTALVLLDVAGDLRADGHYRDSDELLRLIARRYGDTTAAEEANRLLAGVRRSGRPGEGTAEFVAWHTTLGAILGVMVPDALGATDPEPYGAGLLAGGPLGYALSRHYASRHPLTSGQALAIDYASVWGMIQLPMWQDILDIGGGTECFGTGVNRFCYDIDRGSTTGATVVGALAGLGAGLVLASNRPVSTATALSAMFASQWGMWYGVVLRTYPGLEDGDGGLAWIAVGGNLGLLAAIFGAPKLDWSPSRVWLVHLSGVAGLLAGGGLALLLDVQDDAASATLFGVASAVGLAAGVASTAGLDAGPGGGSERSGLATALFDRSNGAWRVGVPLPQPALLPTAGHDPRPFTRGLRVNLLKARW